jgi:GNAT superfamily N-acetyltransferase
MELPTGLRLSFEEKPSGADREFVDEALGAYNAPFLRNPGYSYFGIFVREDAGAARGAIRAGLIGNCYAGWLFVALLWVHADFRRVGIGHRLMAEAERHGREFGCHSAWVDTFTFQGPNFYPKLGYVEFTRIDYPPDHQRISFRKQLQPE